MNRFPAIAYLLLAISAPAAQITLAWDANPEPDIAGYVLFYGPHTGHYTNAIDTGNVTNRVVTGLVPGADYYFVLTAYNTSCLESDPSNEVHYTVPLGPTNSTTNVTLVVSEVIETAPTANGPWTAMPGTVKVRTNSTSLEWVVECPTNSALYRGRLRYEWRTNSTHP